MDYISKFVQPKRNLLSSRFSRVINSIFDEKYALILHQTFQYEQLGIFEFFFRDFCDLEESKQSKVECVGL